MKLVQNILVMLVIMLINLKNCVTQNCDKYGILLYEDMACEPIKPQGHSCPIKYECNFNQAKNGCVFKGRTYSAGEKISSELTYSGCSSDVRCEGFGSISWSYPDCKSVYYDYSADCYTAYELGKCCPIDSICNSIQTRKCQLGNESYPIGAQFSPQNTCLDCVCHENFTGDFDENTCVRRNCNAQIHYSLWITQKCAPVYIGWDDDIPEVLCCPDDFVCPESTDKIKIVNPKADRNSNLECFYGEKKLKLGEGFRRYIYKYGHDRNLLCECILPPLLTCREVEI